MRTFTSLATPASLALLSSLVPCIVSAEEVPLGVEEKLKAVYDLYRADDIVTLRRHEFSMGLSLGYGIAETRVFGIQDTTRTLASALTLTYGLTDALQVSLTTPLLLRENKAEDTTTTYFTHRAGGVGDVTLGMVATLPTQSLSTTVGLSATLPTGQDDFGSDGIVSTVRLSVDKVLQPAFVYGSVSWMRDWDASKDALGYGAGAGFFLNHALSMGLGVEGTFALSPERGMPRDVLSLTGQVSYQATPSFGITPSVSFGLVGDVPDVQLGLSMLWRW